MIEKNDTLFCRQQRLIHWTHGLKFRKKVLLMLIMFSSIGEAAVKVK